jgi:Arc/MetJ-type ribon-helix-helix transcriptional regulator
VIIHVRLREQDDEDIKAWYGEQSDKSTAVREAIRAYIQIQSGESQEAAIREAVAQAMAHLPALVAEAVREALAAYRLSPVQEQPSYGEEDPEQAARLEAQLDDFFGE